MKLYPILLLVYYHFCGIWAFAQPADHVIRGRILDEVSQEVIRGVMIESPEFAAYGTFSDNNGVFSLHISSANAVTVKFSRNGYTEKRILLSPDIDPVQIRLSPATAEIAVLPLVVEEYRMKINFLRRFIEKASWNTAPANTAQPFVIAILGTNPFGDDLLAFESLQLHGRSVEIEFLASTEDIYAQDVLLICKPNNSLLRDISAKLTANPLFSICDECGKLNNLPFVISLFTDENAAVRYSIYKTAAQAANISFDTALYQFSTTR